MGAIMEHNSEDRLSKINVPTLVIHGDEDLVVPVENGRLLAAKIKNARIVVLPATGHLYALNTRGGWVWVGCALIMCACAWEIVCACAWEGHRFWDMEPERSFQTVTAFLAEGDARL